MGEKIKQKRTDIQALRMIAVLAVVVYHLWPNRLTGGFMGVDIFFVLSGYLMTLTLIKHSSVVVLAKKKGKATLSYLSEFYSRRIKRLIPAASVTLLVTLGLVVATGNLSMIEDTAKQIAASAVFSQNWLLASESVDYLANAEMPTAVQHFWTLSLEEQFYLVWPLLLLSISFLTLHLTVVYKKQKISGAVIPVAVLIVIFFIYGYYLTQTNPSAAYFVTPARVWELLLGGLIAFLPALRNHDLKLMLPWLGLAMTVYPLFKWDGAGFPGWHALIPVIGTALVIYGGTTQSDSQLSFTNLFKYKPIQWIGDISYSLYLWHWPLIILVPVLLTMNIDGQYSLYIKLGILLLSFILAWLSYKYIELPPQRWNIKKRWTYLSFILIAGVIVSAGLLVSSLSRTQANSSLEAMHSIVLSEEKCIGAQSLVSRDQCNNTFDQRDQRFEQLGPMDKFTTVTRTDKQCEVYHPNALTTPSLDRYCTVGDLDSDNIVSVWGDSHATHWVNAFDRIGLKNNIKFVIFSSGRCGGIDSEKQECRDVINFIKESRILDESSSVIVALWFRYPSDFTIQPTSLAIKTVQSLTNTPVFLLEDIPIPGNNAGTNCLIIGADCKNSKEDAISAIKGVSERIVSDNLLERNKIIQTDDLFCDSSYCYAYIGGIPVYNSYAPKDDTLAVGGNAHLTASYSLSIADMLDEKLQNQGALKPKSVQPTPISSMMNKDEDRPANSERCAK